MRKWTAVIATIAAGAFVALASPTATAAPPGPVPVPPRTSISFQSIVPGFHFGTPNQNEIRSGLSIVKLYLADYALRHGDGSAEDRALTERMIRYSDDAAAARISAKYPHAIDAIAAEYHLTDTRTGTDWGTSYTSTADVATFLEDKQISDPGSPILRWMETAGAVAADGTRQNWGTTRLPGIQGTKWGWSDFGPPQVASASFGPGFAIAAQTHGTPADQNADVLGSVPRMLIDSLLDGGA